MFWDLTTSLIGGTRVALAGASAYAIPNGTSDSVALLNFAVVTTSDSKSYSYMTVTEIQLSDPTGSFGTAPAINGLFQVTGLPTPTPHRGGGGSGIVTGIEQMPGITQVSNASNKTPTATVTATITPTATPTLTPMSVAPKQTYRLLILLILALVVIVIYYYCRKRKQA